MRLVVKRNIAEQIAQEIAQAEVEGLTVERVEVTRQEMADLAKCPEEGDRLRSDAGEFFVLGIPVVLEESVKRAERVHA